MAWLSPSAAARILNSPDMTPDPVSAMTVLIVLVSNSQSVLPASLEVVLTIVCVLAIVVAFRSEKNYVAAARAAHPPDSTLPSGPEAPLGDTLETDRGGETNSNG